MDINTVRKANIRRLVEQCGSNKAFAKTVDTDPAYVSALLSDKIQRNPGDQFMRRVEKAFKLNAGALDFPDETAMAAALALQALPENSRHQAFHHIKYLIESAPARVINQEVAQNYLQQLDRLSAPKAKRPPGKPRKPGPQ